ncbi:MAG: hypothetical protein KDI80_15365, partial [Xanthomonadales bacterium]|nr:hypothetical protein [Xanthomonadales bacterium]
MVLILSLSLRSFDGNGEWEVGNGQKRNLGALALPIPYSPFPIPESGLGRFLRHFLGLLEGL